MTGPELDALANAELLPQGEYLVQCTGEGDDSYRVEVLEGAYKGRVLRVRSPYCSGGKALFRVGQGSTNSSGHPRKVIHPMTQEPNTSKANAPAFSISESYPYASGLSKRELFTAAALTGLCAEATRAPGTREEIIEKIALSAVALADATIKELER